MDTARPLVNLDKPLLTSHLENTFQSQLQSIKTEVAAPQKRVQQFDLATLVNESLQKQNPQLTMPNPMVHKKQKIEVPKEANLEKYLAELKKDSQLDSRDQQVFKSLLIKIKELKN